MGNGFATTATDCKGRLEPAPLTCAPEPVNIKVKAVNGTIDRRTANMDEGNRYTCIPSVRPAARYGYLYAQS
jgi:hypothetical protein